MRDSRHKHVLDLSGKFHSNFKWKQAESTRSFLRLHSQKFLGLCPRQRARKTGHERIVFEPRVELVGSITRYFNQSIYQPITYPWSTQKIRLA
ncbi:hypothetical protein AYM40_29130 [Paraburkholderia phytofirmans OLGA172]|uniref:Uncharacterized protein n=1 Tax=Paraburkholderia phytofirmans OLGA172 TaxID=1417228 RepID=A0A160FTK8_9BURK|nr:hypothetical protein AYM40_29130 [Paraburkholderia phytofirmans OLGA172]